MAHLAHSQTAGSLSTEQLYACIHSAWPSAKLVMETQNISDELFCQKISQERKTDMIPGEVAGCGAHLVEWVWSCSRVAKAPSPSERFTEHRSYSRHGRGAGHTAVNSQLPALGGGCGGWEPRHDQEEGQ